MGELEIPRRAGKFFQLIHKLESWNFSFLQNLKSKNTLKKFDFSQIFSYNIPIKNERSSKIIMEKDNSKMKPSAARKLQKEKTYGFLQSTHWLWNGAGDE